MAAVVIAVITVADVDVMGGVVTGVVVVDFYGIPSREREGSWSTLCGR